MAKKKSAVPKKVKNTSLELTVKEATQKVEMAINQLMSRSKYLNKNLDDRRSINDDCGYPDNPDIDSHFLPLYEREGVARRTVNIYPDECWKSIPSVFETDDTDEETEFEKAFGELGKSLMGEEDHYNPEDSGHPLWEYLHRLDIVSGIGRYGVLLLGFDDSEDFSKEVQPRNGKIKLVYVRVFHEANAQITKLDENKNSSRYGQPVEYSLSTTNVSSVTDSETSVDAMKVHWTRVIHVADTLVTNELYGTPRLKSNLNRQLDLRKLYGGSAEMYWRGAFPGLALQTNPNMDPDYVIDRTALKDNMENFFNSLQRYSLLEGLEANMLAPTVVDPSPQVAVQIDAICIDIQCPRRIFTGSERGELASSQDSEAWEGRLKSRRTEYITPKIIVKVINRLIKVGILPVPPEGFKVAWEETQQLSEELQAKIAEIKTKAIAAYLQGDGSNLIAPEDFLTRILGFTGEETQEILDATEKYLIDNPIEEEFDDGLDEFGNPQQFPEENIKPPKQPSSNPFPTTTKPKPTVSK